jgi:hypothetical protein
MTISARPRLVGLIATAALISACVASPGASINKVEPSDAAPPTSYPSPGSKCISNNTVVTTADPTMTNLARFSTGVVIGTFNGFGDAEWNTPSGLAPVTAAEKSLSVWIFRPIKITPSSALRGDPSIVVNARIKGGNVGCDSAHYSDEPVLKDGASYVFFLEPEWEPKEARATDPWVLWAWPVNPDGTVRTPLEGDVSLTDLTQVVATTPIMVLPTPMPIPTATSVGRLGRGGGRVGTAKVRRLTRHLPAVYLPVRGYRKRAPADAETDAVARLMTEAWSALRRR